MAKLDNEDYEQLARALADAIKGGKGTAFGGIDTTNMEALMKSMQRFQEQVKKSFEPLEMYANTVKGIQKPIVDLREQFEDLEKAIEKREDGIDKEDAREELRARKRELVNRNATQAALNFGIGVTKAGLTMAGGAWNFVKNLQSGAGGIEASSSLLISSIEAAGQAAEQFGSSLSDIGMILTTIPAGRIVGAFLKIAGVLGMVVGPALEAAAKAATKLATEGVRYLEEELKKTRDSFKEITSAGVIFGNGMTEMRNAAFTAGMRLKDFSTFVRNNTEYLAQLGIGVTEAARRIANVSGVLRSGRLGEQLQNLGYSFEEQAGLAAQTAAQLQATGKLRSASDAEVARLTVQYGKDLKVIQQITGEDARKKIDEARKEAMAAEIRAKLFNIGGPMAVARFTQVLATMPDSIKKGFLEKIATGGQAITDTATNVAIAQNASIGRYLDVSYRAVMDANLDQSQAMDISTKALERAGQASLQNADNFSALGTAARLGQDGILQGTNAIQTAFIDAGVRIGEGATEGARIAAEKLANTADPLTNSVNRLEAETNRQAVIIEQKIGPYLFEFSELLRKTVQTFAEILPMLEAALGKVRSELAAKTTAKTPQIESAKSVAMALGGDKGFAFDYNETEARKFAQQQKERQEKLKDAPWYTRWYGIGEESYLKEKAARENKTGSRPMASGGIIRSQPGGTTVRAAEAGLNEAYVPLPDGDSIPVKFKSPTSSLPAVSFPAASATANGETQEKMSAMLAGMISQSAPGKETTETFQKLESLLRLQIDKQDEVISQLRETNNINSQILTNSYT